MTVENRLRHKAFLDQFTRPSPDGFDGAIHDFIAADADVNVCHPVNTRSGAQGYQTHFIGPLHHAFENLYRRDYISLAGHCDGTDWVSSTGYFAGKFIHPLFGIKPTRQFAYLRVGEFHRLQNGQSVESYTFLDLPELMMRTDQWPLAPAPGYVGQIPGPASNDGLRLTASHPDSSAKTLHLVETMLENLGIDAWRACWHEDMKWYGPAGFGSFRGVHDVRDFQVHIETALKGWGGGYSDDTSTHQFARYGDGQFACSGGWPSGQGTHVKPCLGVAPTGVTTQFRVCDWWRREGDELVENWVCVDIPHVLLQWGHDLFAECPKP